MKTKKSPSKTPIALIYLRVSTARQANEGVGLDTQENKCLLHAERLGWSVSEIFKDAGISGRDGLHNRPGLRDLIAKAKELRAQGQNPVIVTYSISRLARRQKLLYELLDERDGHGLSVSSATEAFDTTTPTGRAMLGMISVFAALEADMISERVRDSMAEAKAQGVKMGQKSMRELNSELVDEVQRLYASGRYTTRSLAEELNKTGTSTPSGRGKWTHKSVQVALKQ